LVVRARNILISLCLIISGLFVLGTSYNLITLNYTIFLEYILLFLGVTLVLTSANNSSRSFLFLGSLLFICGSILFVVDNFEILTPIKIVLPSILFAFGAAFLILYIDNTQEKIFLFISIILMGISLLVIILLKNNDLYSIANRVSFLILEFWPILVSLIGLGILLNRNYR
jgi:hypothetical protein